MKNKVDECFEVISRMSNEELQKALGMTQQEFVYSLVIDNIISTDYEGTITLREVTFECFEYENFAFDYHILLKKLEMIKEDLEFDKHKNLGDELVLYNDKLLINIKEAKLIKDCVDYIDDVLKAVISLYRETAIDIRSFYSERYNVDLKDILGDLNIGKTVKGIVIKNLLEGGKF